jgi:hypothetical protein
LSYTWGQPIPIYGDDEEEVRKEKDTGTGERNCYISIDGKRLAVTRNLIDYFQHHIDVYENGDDSPPIWVDAICINQEDISEKNRLVGRMYEVYRQAASVSAWLGLYDHFSGPALEFIDKIATRTLSDIEWSKGAGGARDKLELALGPMIHSRTHWKAICRLFSRKWFRRCWVIQEAILARDMHAMVGSATIPFTSLLRAARLIGMLQKHYYDGVHVVWNTWIISSWSNLDNTLPERKERKPPGLRSELASIF